MKCRKWIALLLALLLVLTGCGKSTDREPAAKQTEATIPEETPLQTDPETEPATETETASTEATQATVPAEAVQIEDSGASGEVKIDLFALTGAQKQNLSAGRQYEINIFMSNFAETSYAGEYFYKGGEGPLLSQTADPMELVDFVFWHNIFNNNLVEKCDNPFEVFMTMDQINATSKRFFDRTLSASQISGDRYTVEDQTVKMLLAVGDQHLDVSIVNGMWRKPDGNYVVSFDIYWMTPEDGQWQYTITDKSVYYLTPETVQSTTARYLYSGMALVKPYKHNGGDSYQLLAYELFF